jgi:hypothetical protein
VKRVHRSKSAGDRCDAARILQQPWFSSTNVDAIAARALLSRTSVHAVSGGNLGRVLAELETLPDALSVDQAVDVLRFQFSFLGLLTLHDEKGWT